MDEKLERINALLKPYGFFVEMIFTGGKNIEPAMFSTNKESIASEFSFGVKQLPDRRLSVYVWSVRQSDITDFSEYQKKVDDIGAVLKEITEMKYLVPTKEQYEEQHRRFQIWQIPNDSPHSRKLKFTPMSLICQQGDPDEILTRDKYQLVYGGVSRPGDTLEDIYYRFNMQIPLSFTGSPLSVSDVVVLNGKAYFVDNVGFVELKNF